MIIYNYHPETLEFIYKTEADLDPLETKLQGINVYLIPANSTDKKPPELSEGETCIFRNSEWVKVPDYRGRLFYHKEYGYEVVGDFIENIPENLTLEAPEVTIDRLREEAIGLNRQKHYEFQNTPKNYTLVDIENNIHNLQFNCNDNTYNNIKSSLEVCNRLGSVYLYDDKGIGGTFNLETIDQLLQNIIIIRDNSFKVKGNLLFEINQCNELDEIQNIINRLKDWEVSYGGGN